MKIALDVMGTDFGPEEIILGAIQAVKEYTITVYLVGREEEIKQVLAKFGESDNSSLVIVDASEVISMEEHPALAVKMKKNASIVVATRLLREKTCDALVSAGSTGAAVAAALFGIGRIKGIERPAIATAIPNVKGTTVIVDSGAKVDAKPVHLLQNAIMGSIYAQMILQMENPRVGLLNIGEEESKGNEQVLGAYPLLKEQENINFIGNVEGRDINSGAVDVVICDGFVGNIVLKVEEGLAKAFITMLRRTLKESGFWVKVGALLIKPAVLRMKKKIDAAEYGGALLLGVREPFIICHGSSKAKAIKNALGMAVNFAEKNVIGKIGETVNPERVV